MTRYFIGAVIRPRSGAISDYFLVPEPDKDAVKEETKARQVEKKKAEPVIAAVKKTMASEVDKQKLRAEK